MLLFDFYLAYSDHYPPEEFEDSSLFNFDLEGWRNLCVTAKEGFQSTKLKFFDNYVPEARAFQLEYSNREETTLAVPCPTLPLLIVHIDSAGLLMSSVIHSPPINEYDDRNSKREFQIIIVIYLLKTCTYWVS